MSHPLPDPRRRSAATDLRPSAEPATSTRLLAAITRALENTRRLGATSEAVLVLSSPGQPTRLGFQPFPIGAHPPSVAAPSELLAVAICGSATATRRSADGADEVEHGRMIHVVGRHGPSITRWYGLQSTSSTALEALSGTADTWCRSIFEQCG